MSGMPGKLSTKHALFRGGRLYPPPCFVFLDIIRREKECLKETPYRVSQITIKRMMNVDLTLNGAIFCSVFRIIRFMVIIFNTTKVCIIF